MDLLITAAGTAVFSVLCSRLVKARPSAFYGAAILLCVLGVWFTWHPAPYQLLRSIAFTVQKGQLGFCLIALVMFIGTLDRHSGLYRRMYPVRGELSIMGSILMLGHAVPYLKNYLDMMGGVLLLRGSIVLSLIISLVLLIVLALLCGTSFELVKHRMSSVRWKAMQKLAYPFFFLIYVHLMGYLIIPASSGSMRAFTNCIAYSIVFIGYGFLRMRRAWRDKKEEQMSNYCSCGCDSLDEGGKKCTTTG